MPASPRRCRAREVAIDGPVPVDCHCVCKAGHEPPHHCQHGFHWLTGKALSFKGVCGECKREVTLARTKEKS